MRACDANILGKPCPQSSKSSEGVLVSRDQIARAVLEIGHRPKAVILQFEEIVVVIEWTGAQHRIDRRSLWQTRHGGILTDGNSKPGRQPTLRDRGLSGTEPTQENHSCERFRLPRRGRGYYTVRVDVRCASMTRRSLAGNSPSVRFIIRRISSMSPRIGPRGSIHSLPETSVPPFLAAQRKSKPQVIPRPLSRVAKCAGRSTSTISDSSRPIPFFARKVVPFPIGPPDVFLTS